MNSFLDLIYPYLKALHIIAVISWMAGIFYLPRLFIYHNDADPKNSDQIETFKLMEYRLLKVIMNPAMIVTWVVGFLLVDISGIDWSMIWPWIKLVCIFGITWFHMWLGKQRKLFEAGTQVLETKTYRYMNEVPTVLMIIIVIMIVVRPF